MNTTPLHIETPLVESRALSARAGRPVWLKLESVQPTGSFKIRGIGHACTEYARRGARHFVSSSGGNAGLATAYAGRRLGIPVTVIVPTTTTTRAIELIRAEGAEVIVHGASWQEANAHAETLLGEDHALLHPFDDPLIWEGHATLVDEISGAGLKPDAVLLSVGGGGLLCGVAAGLARSNMAGVPIIAVETRGADSLSQALRAGQPVELPAITSIATSLGARQVCRQAVEFSRHRPISSIVVSDRQALQACRTFLDDQRLLVEPACGAALAPLYAADPALQQFEAVLVVVCGGVGVTLDQLGQWLDRFDTP